MTNPTISTISNIIESLQNKAEWRDEVSTRFPDDDRNEEAAKELRSLANEITELARSGAKICQQVEDLENAVIDEAEGDVHDLWREFDEELTGVGFRTGFGNGTSLLERYHEKLEEIMQRLIEDENADDDGVPSPDLKAQVENDPAVMAAKQALNEARAKAYAEARKRL